jgi:hypothetical protein
MAHALPGRLGTIAMDGELPRREALGAGRGGRHLIVPPGQEPPGDAQAHVLRTTGMNVMFGVRTLDPDPARPRRSSRRRASTPTPNARTHRRRAWSRPRGGGGAAISRAAWSIGCACMRSISAKSSTSATASISRCSVSSGIEPGKPFAPDGRLLELLEQASAAGELMAQANTFAKRFDGSRYWPDRQWDLVLPLDNSAQRGPHYDELLERASWFYEAVSFSAAMKSQTPGKGQAYLSAYTSTDGAWLDGGTAYTLHVPADPPAKPFWSITVHDARTRCLIDNNQQRGDRGSRDPDLMHNPDNSVDLFFGPTAPPGGQSNWVQTIPSRHWFSYARFYGPLEPYFDRSWKLGDITAVDHG